MDEKEKGQDKKKKRKNAMGGIMSSTRHANTPQPQYASNICRKAQRI